MRLVVSVSMLVSTIVFIASGVAWAEPDFAIRAEGYVGYANLSADNGSETDDEGTFEGGGAGSVSVALDDIYLQGDVFGDSTNYNSFDLHRVGGGGHLGWRNAERGSAGIVGAINHAYHSSDNSDDAWRAGIEGELFIDRLTLGLESGYYDGDASTNINANEVAYIVGSVAYYPIERARLEFRGGGLGVGKENTVGIIGAAGELLVADFASVFVRWEASILDANIDIDQHSIVAGVRLYWGADEPSLEAYDRAHFNRSCIGFQTIGRSC